MTDPTGDPFVGTIIDERYEVISKIAEGGMGAVYFARNKRLDVDAALKILHTNLARNKKFLVRFENEAKTVVRLRHTNIVQVFDIGPIRDTYYIAMEFIEGEDLVGVIGRSGRLTLQEAMPIAVQVAQGLAYAHEGGILHRDIKPANIIIEPQGRAVITDFGISRTAKTRGDTTLGSIVGTPEYMSLEQLKGMELDERSDIYSLGVVLYEMLTGISPFRADESVQAIAKVLSEEAPPIETLVPDLPPWVCEIVRKTMAKDRDERFSSIREFLVSVKEHLKDAVFLVPEVVSPKRRGLKKGPALISTVTSIIEQIPREKRLLTGIISSLIVIGLIVTAVLLVKSISLPSRSTGPSEIIPLGTSRLAEREWAFRTFGPITASPLVSGGAVYVGSGDGTLTAVDVKKGQQLWVFKAQDDICTTPAVSGKALYFGSDDNSLYALSTKNGDLLWRFTTENDVRSSPTVTDKLVIFGSDDNYLYALNKETGEELWRFKTCGDVVSCPAVADKVVYFGSCDNIFYAVTIDDGKEVWRYRAGGDIQSSPSVTKKAVLFGSDDDYLYALNRETGQELWRFETDGDVVSCPAVGRDTVYFGSKDNWLYAVNLEKGTLTWRFETMDDIYSSASLTERSVLIGSDDKNVYTVNIVDGVERWRFPTEGKVRSGPVVSGGIAFFGSRDGYLYAVR
ncbi:MAG: PQQ-binding-like beta-propeller repeat protein [Deltaproteobacteria bacterium]|nr:PQQ-binding-like beta-propeller repeat protein [Candidatus Zymogenaceae bacterium]